MVWWCACRNFRGKPSLDPRTPARCIEHMKNDTELQLGEPDTGSGLSRPDVTAAVTRGTARLLVEAGHSVLPEFCLPVGRRVDLAALDKRGNLTFVEVKSGSADFVGDRKWQEYLPYCDTFYFATACDFPVQLLPEGVGHIMSDRFGGEILRPGPTASLNPARRKATILAFARQAAARMWRSDAGFMVGP